MRLGVEPEVKSPSKSFDFNPDFCRGKRLFSQPCIRLTHSEKLYVGHVCGKSFPIATFVRRLLLNKPEYFQAKSIEFIRQANFDLESFSAYMP